RRLLIALAPALSDNGLVLEPGASRQQLAQALNTAYAEGLLSEETFAGRLDLLMRGRLIEPRRLIGGLTVRAPTQGVRARLTGALAGFFDLFDGAVADRTEEPWTLLALDWSGRSQQLILGRHHACDVVLGDPSVSRRHARLTFRDERWVLNDLDSLNGTLVNG